MTPTQVEPSPTRRPKSTPTRRTQADPRVMGTRFVPADPEAVRQRFAAIRARAFERVAEEQRLMHVRLADHATP